MGDNSRREQVLVRLAATLGGLASINTVKRVQPTGMEQLKAYSAKQLPLSVVLGGLPAPREKYSNRGRDLHKVVSDLSVSIFTYAMDNVSPDSTISSLADDIWVGLYTDVTQGFKWVHSTRVIPEPATGIWDPYCGLVMRAVITYEHSKGGI